MAVSSQTPEHSANKSSPPRANSDYQVFLRALASALFALGISAALLLAAYITFSPELARYSTAASNEDIQPRTIHAGDLTIRLGTGKKTTEKAFHLTGLSNDGRALLTQNISLNASDYPFVQYDITGRHPQEFIYLMWRTAEQPNKTSVTPLHWSGSKATGVHLGQVEEWRGRITEIGIDVYGDLRGQPLEISTLTFTPGSSRALLSTIWSEWTAFRGWSQKSINRLPGAAKNAILSPTLAAAAWAGLSIFLLYGAQRLRRSHNFIAYGAVVLIPWVLLDLLWQGELTTQLRESQFLFSGKSTHEKHLADEDHDIYRYAKRLQDEVLPPAPARIFILHDSEGHNYDRLKTQYYLLPHNIYNYGRYPKKKRIKPGDFILVLGDIPGLKYREQAQRLVWQKNARLPVTRVDKDGKGQLFQVMPAFGTDKTTREYQGSPQKPDQTQVEHD